MIDINEYVKNYSYIIQYSSEDEAYLAKCAEMGIMAHGDSQEEAIKEIKDAVQVHLLMMLEDGDDIPQPQSILAS